MMRTERLVLREMVETDWTALHAIVSLPEVVQFQTEDTFDEEATRAAISLVIEGAAAEPRLLFDFAVTLDDAMIGRVGFRRGSDLQTASLWFEIAPIHHGKGYGAEAARAVLGYAFETVLLHRVAADCDPRNPSSARVMEKIGMRREAHLVQNVFIKGEWCDSLVFAMLASEWRR